jgi:hypothetical protein
MFFRKFRPKWFDKIDYSLIVSYTTNGYPTEYVPMAIDTYDVVVHVDGAPVTFEMCDTPGQVLWVDDHML